MKNNRENRIGWGKVCRWAGIWIRLSLFTLFILTEPLVVEAAGQSVTLRLENVSLKEAFKEIKRQLGYRLAYNEQVINTIGNVSVDVVSGNINEVMEQCLILVMRLKIRLLLFIRNKPGPIWLLPRN